MKGEEEMNISITENMHYRTVCIARDIDDGLSDDREYEFKMLKENDIPVFLSLTNRMIEGNMLYEYDVSGMISLKRLCEVNLLRIAEIKMLVCTLNKCQKVINDFLLSPEGLILDPEYIFYDKKTKTVRYCFYPLRETDLFSSYTKLGEFLLSSIDYSDETAVLKAYDIYASILNKDYDFTRFFEAESESATEPENLHDDISVAKETDRTSDLNEAKGENCEGKAMPYESNVSLCAEPKFSVLSIACITLLFVIIVLLTGLYAFSSTIFKYLISDSKVVSVLMLITCISIYFPVMNISDIARTRRTTQYRVK